MSKTEGSQRKKQEKMGLRERGDNSPAVQAFQKLKTCAQAWEGEDSGEGEGVKVKRGENLQKPDCMKKAVGGPGGGFL